MHVENKRLEQENQILKGRLEAMERVSRANESRAQQAEAKVGCGRMDGRCMRVLQVTALEKELQEARREVKVLTVTVTVT